jgi:hypothetical protein
MFVARQATFDQNGRLHGYELPFRATADRNEYDAARGIRPMHEEIAALAYSFWVERGCPEGTPEHDWFRAEQELKAKWPSAAIV